MCNSVDDEGEFRRFKKRRLSTASVKSVVSSLESSCTARPLTTPPVTQSTSTTKADISSSLLAKTAQLLRRNSSSLSLTNSSVVDTNSDASNSANECLLRNTFAKSSFKNKKCSSKATPGINSILKQPSSERDQPNPSTIPICKAPTTSLSTYQTVTANQPQFVTWKDIKDRAKAAELKKASEDGLQSPLLGAYKDEIYNKPTPSRFTNLNSYSYEGHSIAMRTKSFQPSSVYSSPISNSTKRASQPDLTVHKINQIQRPKSQTNLQNNQPVHYLPYSNSRSVNSSFILNPISYSPSSRSSSPLTKTMQRPVSVPPRTIHPSLRSHFAIDKSKGLPVINTCSIRPGHPGSDQKHPQHYQPIATPLLNTQECFIGPRQTYQHYQMPMGTKNTRIETDIM